MGNDLKRSLCARPSGNSTSQELFGSSRSSTVHCSRNAPVKAMLKFKFRDAFKFKINSAHCAVCGDNDTLSCAVVSEVPEKDANEVQVRCLVDDCPVKLGHEQHGDKDSKICALDFAKDHFGYEVPCPREIGEREVLIIVICVLAIFPCVALVLIAFYYSRKKQSEANLANAQATSNEDLELEPPAEEELDQTAMTTAQYSYYY